MAAGATPSAAAPTASARHSRDVHSPSQSPSTPFSPPSITSSAAPNRRQTIITTIHIFKAIKNGRFGVIALKGGLAIAQTATIVALLVVSYHTNSKWGDGEVVQARVSKVACGRPLEKWILASSVRLMVCWWISLWIVWRKGRLDTESRGSEEGGIGIER